MADSHYVGHLLGWCHLHHLGLHLGLDWLLRHPLHGHWLRRLLHLHLSLARARSWHLVRLLAHFSTWHECRLRSLLRELLWSLITYRAVSIRSVLKEVRAQDLLDSFDIELSLCQIVFIWLDACLGQGLDPLVYMILPSGHIVTKSWGLPGCSLTLEVCFQYSHVSLPASLEGAASEHVLGAHVGEFADEDFLLGDREVAELNLAHEDESSVELRRFDVRSFVLAGVGVLVV